MSEPLPEADRIALGANVSNPLDRRAFFKGVLNATIGATVLGHLLDDAHDGTKTLLGRGLRAIDSWASQGAERDELITGLFGGNGLTQMIPGRSNPLQPGLHPDDKWTMKKLGCMFAGQRLICDEDLPPNPNANYICLGSPQSNAVSMQQLAYARLDDGSVAPSDKAQGPTYRLAIDYAFPSLLERTPDRPVKILRYVEGKLVERPLYSLWPRTTGERTSRHSRVIRIDQPIYPKWASGGWLAHDWLLLTRVPNLTCPGYFVTILGGMYGTGTKGSVSLMRDLPTKEIREINAQREGAESFQSLFRVSVDHNHPLKESVARTIEHLQTFPLDIDYRSHVRG